MKLKKVILRESVSINNKIFEKGKQLSILESDSLNQVCEYVLFNLNKFTKERFIKDLIDNFYFTKEEAPLIFKAALLKLKMDRKIESNHTLLN